MKHFATTTTATPISACGPPQNSAAEREKVHWRILIFMATYNTDKRINPAPQAPPLFACVKTTIKIFRTHHSPCTVQKGIAPRREIDRGKAAVVGLGFPR